MKKVLLTAIALILMVSLVACSRSESQDERNARSILNSTPVQLGEKYVSVTIEEIEFIDAQIIKNMSYSYYVVKTTEHNWGFAELKDNAVRTFDVGYTESIARTRCEDCVEYRASKYGSMFE